MKDLFNGIPRKRVLIDFLYGISFSLINCGWTTLVTSIVNKKFEDSLLKFIALLFVYVLMWQMNEFIGELHAELTTCIIENEVSRYYIRELYKIKPDILKKKNTGYISGVMQKLVTQQATAYLQIIQDVPINIVYIGYFGIVLGKYNVFYGILLAATYITSNLVRWLINVRFTSIKAEELADAEGSRNKLTIDLISNMNTVQKMSAVTYMDEKVVLENLKCIKKTRSWKLADELSYVLAKAMMFAYFPACLCIMYFTDDVSSQMDVRFLALLAAVSTQAVHNSKALFRALRSYNRFVGALSKLKFIEDNDNRRLPTYKRPFVCADIEPLVYRYDEIIDGQKKSIEINIPEFHVDKGDFVCITGESGQGKTTLLDILSGQIETDSVVINNDILSKGNRLDCVFVSQDTEIFDMSLRDNLTLGKDVDTTILCHFLSVVGMKDWLQSQPRFLKTMLGERGVFVSTGQRQRLNLIRGLLIEDKEIYLLDEPTSNVDTKTEEYMVKLIKEQLKGKTVIIVSHRPMITEICNVKYEFKNGVLHKIQEAES